MNEEIKNYDLKCNALLIFLFFVVFFVVVVEITVKNKCYIKIIIN